MPKNNFFRELKRRNVYRVAITYAIVAWLLLQIVSVVSPIIEAPLWMSKVVLIILLTGFPVALVLAWAFEMSPQGIVRTSNLSEKLREDSSPSKQKKSVVYNSVIISLLLVIAIQFTYNRLTTDATAKSEIEKSIAVLPFTDMSPQQDQEYFSDGMMEEIRNHLHQIGALRTSSRTSSMRFKGISNKSIREIGEELQVDHVLEGSVRKQDNNIRITVTLIDVDTEDDLWSETYDRELNDVFAIQDDIARHIAKALEAEISPDEQSVITTVPTSNLKAYDLYLKGKEFTEKYLHSGNEGDFKIATQLLQEAINIDPAFALAYVEMGFAFQWKQNVARSFFGNIIKNDFLLTAEEKFLDIKGLTDTVLVLSNKAIDLNPKLSRAHQLRAWSFWDQDETDQAIAACQRAILLDPKDEMGFKFLGLIYMTLGEFEKAYLNYARCFDLSIYYRPIDYVDVGQLYMQVGALETAQYYFEKSLAVLPNFYWGFNTLTWLHAIQGNFTEALYYSEKGIALYPEKAENYINHAYVLGLLKKFDQAEEYLSIGLSMMDAQTEITKNLEGGYIFWMNGNKEEGTKRLNQQIDYALRNIELQTNYGIKRAPYDLAAAYAFLNNVEEAYKWLRHCLKHGFKGGLEHYILNDPHFQNLHKDQEFRNIIQQEQAQKSKIRTRIKQLEKQEGKLLM